MKFNTSLKDKKTGYVQYEIKYTTSNGTQGIVIVGLDGWDYSQSENRNNYANYRFSRTTKGNHVRISMNGPAWFSLPELIKLNDEILRCYDDLLNNYAESRNVDR